MVTLRIVSKFTKAGILMMLLGLLILGLEDALFDESMLLTALYLLPIACFICSFVAFSIEARRNFK
jgi:hypothetical protein